MAKSALEEYYDLVDQESKSLESYLLSRNEANIKGTVDPKVRELVKQTIIYFKKRSENLTTAEIKTLSAKLAHEKELEIVKIRNEKHDEGKEKDELGGKKPEKKIGKGPADKDKIDGSITQQTKENSTIKPEDRKSTITRGGIGGTGATAAGGGQVRLKGATSRKGPVTASERANSRIRGMQNEIKRGGPGARKIGKPDSALDQARRLKAIQKDNAKNNQQFAEKALKELQQKEKDQKALQAGITADLVARGVISGQKPLTDAEIAKKAANESAAEVAGIDKRHQEIQEAVSREEANKRLAGLRRTMPQILPGDDEEIVEIGNVPLDIFEDKGAGTDDRRARPGRPDDAPQPQQQRRPDPMAPAASDDDDDDDNNRRFRRPKKNKGKAGTKIPDFLKNPLSGASGMKNMGMIARAGAFFATPAGWITLGVIIVIILILLIIFIISGYEDERAKEEALRNAATETLTIRKEKVNPPQLTANPNEVITFNIVVTDTKSAQEIVIIDYLPEGVSLAEPDVVSSWVKRVYDPAKKTITWKASENLPPGGLNAPTFTITVSYKVVANNLHLITWAEANPIRGGAVSGNWIAPSDDLCGGKYDRAVQRNPINKNFGDPACSFNKDLLYTLIQQADPANADVWFNKIIPCESGYNPNAYAGHAQIGTPDAAGAWGLYQMGSATPPGSPPPAPGKNGPNDRGDVNWEIQTQNATTYGKRLASLGSYWACAR